MTWLRVFLILLVLRDHPSAQESARSEARGRPEDMDSAWADLDSPNPAAREAARKKIEAQPFSSMEVAGHRGDAPMGFPGSLAGSLPCLPLSEGPALRPHLCESITTLQIEQMSLDQTLSAIRLTRLVCTRFGEPTEDERQQMLDLWSRFAPPESAETQTPFQRKLAGELKELLSLLGRGH